jgi:hypothetical protein
MRKISPITAISHALNSVVSYRHVAIRIGMFWIPVLLVLGIIETLVGPPDPQSLEFGMPAFVQILSAVVGLIGFCSMAVGWHRFILRDEIGSPARVDGHVLRYAGNSLLIMLMVLVPIAILAVALATLSPIMSVLIVPAVLVGGAIITRLSIKLPAVALGRTDFGFKEAWAASEDNFWQFLGIFLLNAVIVFGAILVLILVVLGIGQFSQAAAQAAGLILGAIVQLFYTLFNASIFTSLYGFFVERREF